MRCLILAVAAALAVTPLAHSQTTGGTPPWSKTPYRPTALPTGVVQAKVPDRPGIVAHGPVAQAFVASALAPQDANDDRVGSGDEPWLVLVGPPDATGQAADQIPADVEPKIKISRYDPDTDAGKQKIRDLGMKAGGRGTKALVMESDGTVHYEGVFDLREVVEKLRELLGLEGGDKDDGGWFPNPIRPRIELDFGWGSFVLGLMIGAAITMLRPAVRFGVLLYWAAKSLADQQQQPRPN